MISRVNRLVMSVYFWSSNSTDLLCSYSHQGELLRALVADIARIISDGKEFDFSAISATFDINILDRIEPPWFLRQVGPRSGWLL